MHGTTKALIVVAAALQASANPLLQRQAPSSTVSASSVSINVTSSFEPTATSEPIPLPTGNSPNFPFHGSNGTLYLCSFPDANSTSSTTSYTASVPTATDDDLLSTPASASITSRTVTGRPTSTPTPTEYTLVGPSTTAIVECIQIPHPHEATSSFPAPTGTEPATSVLTSVSATATATAN